MRPALILAAILALTTPVVACAEVPIPSQSERTLLLASARAPGERLTPDVRSYLWFRLSAGLYKPPRPEFVVSFVRGARTSSDDRADSAKIQVILVEAVAPIGEQISRYIDQNPNAPVEAAVRAIRADRRDYDQESCAAVIEIDRRFSALVASAFQKRDSPAGFYHGAYLQIEGYSSDASFSLYVQEGSPLFAWGIDAVSALSRCQSS
jgi:hypothetical protein